MKKWLRLIKEQKLLLDIINVIIGILLIILAIIYFTHPNNYVIMIAALILAGTVNIINGIKRVMNHNKKSSIGFFVVGGFVYLISIFLIFQL